MTECMYRSFGCNYGLKGNIHSGTIKKIEVISKYVEAWIPKILLGDKKKPFDGVVFIDCMCSAGKYKTSESPNVVQGTSLRVFETFMKAKKNNPNKDFLLILNDVDEQSIKCQRCRISEIDGASSINVSYFNEEISIFLQNRKIVEIVSAKNYHVLLFYDPYTADIRWDEIAIFTKHLRENNIKFDLILTHFFQNDTIRALSKNNVDQLKEDSKLKYETTYQCTINELTHKIVDLDNSQLCQWFRNRVVELVSNKLHCQSKLVAYAPIFNKKNKDVYDIVSYSGHISGKNLFKSTMYHENRSIETEGSGSQTRMNLFEEEPGYENDRKDMPEREIFYSANYYARLIAHHFSGKNNVDNAQLHDFVVNHPYITDEGSKGAIDKCLQSLYNVKIQQLGSNRIKTYDFSKIEESINIYD